MTCSHGFSFGQGTGSRRRLTEHIQGGEHVGDDPSAPVARAPGQPRQCPGERSGRLGSGAAPLAGAEL